MSPDAVPTNVKVTLAPGRRSVLRRDRVQAARTLGAQSLCCVYALAAEGQPAAVWDIPFGRNLTGLTGGLLKGWQLSGIGTLESGTPVFIGQDGDTLNVDHSGIRLSGPRSSAFSRLPSPFSLPGQV